MIGCGFVLFFIGAFNIVSILAGGYQVILLDLIVAGIFAVGGAWMMYASAREAVEDRRNTRNGSRGTQNEPFDPSKGYLVFHPETGEELRLWQGHYYRRERGRWIEVPPPR